MENKGTLNTEELRIQGLLDRYLSRHSAENGLSQQEDHLDEDSLAAFVEGNLSQRESQPIVSHLVDCSFCRHVTAELVRLDLAFADVPQQVIAEERQPSRLAEFLGRISSTIFGPNDSSVFAHQEKENAEETTDEEDKKE